MPDAHVKKGKVSFQTEGRLLQELGERLVAKANVALMELIKNAYDADASECRVKFDGEHVEVSDDGHGMTENEFIQNWMHIATPDKQRRRRSRRYKRTVTGSKGIGDSLFDSSDESWLWRRWPRSPPLAARRCFCEYLSTGGK